MAEATKDPGQNIAEMALGSMNVTEGLATTIAITGAPALDPITVVLIDHGFGRGEAIIACYGKAWTAFWGAMGRSYNPGQDHATVREFFNHCDVHYLLGCFSPDPRALKRDKEYLRRIIEAVREGVKRVSPQR